MAKNTRYMVLANDDFHAGWTAFVLGFERNRTHSEAWQVGWETAEDTKPCAAVRAVFMDRNLRTGVPLGHFEIHVEAEEK